MTPSTFSPPTPTPNPAPDAKPGRPESTEDDEEATEEVLAADVGRVREGAASGGFTSGVKHGPNLFLQLPFFFFLPPSSTPPAAGPELEGWARLKPADPPRLVESFTEWLWEFSYSFPPTAEAVEADINEPKSVVVPSDTLLSEDGLTRQLLKEGGEENVEPAPGRSEESVKLMKSEEAEDVLLALVNRSP